MTTTLATPSVIDLNFDLKNNASPEFKPRNLNQRIKYI